MTTNFRFNDKRTWYAAIRKDNIKKIADNMPKQKQNEVVKFWSKWLFGNYNADKPKSCADMCKYANICPLFQEKGHTCSDETEASTYCGKHREFDHIF